MHVAAGWAVALSHVYVHVALVVLFQNTCVSVFSLASGYMGFHDRADTRIMIYNIWPRVDLFWNGFPIEVQGAGKSTHVLELSGRISERVVGTCGAWNPSNCFLQASILQVPACISAEALAAGAERVPLAQSELRLP